jgi:hypothetical protein
MKDRKSQRLFPGGPYVLLHRLSHLLIQSLAMRPERIDQLQQVPDFPHGRLNSAPPVWQRQYADDLREIRIGGGADQQPAGEIAVFVRVAPQPRSCATARTQRVHFQQRRLVKTARLTAFAPHDEVGQIAARPSFVQPQLPAATILRAVHKAVPIEIVDMALWASAHKSGGHYRPTIEASFFIEGLAMDQPSGSLPLLTASPLLHDEPFWKPPDPNSSGGLAWIILSGWRRIKPRSSHVRHDLELAREPQLQNLLQIAHLRPLVETPDNRRMFR